MPQKRRLNSPVGIRGVDRTGSTAKHLAIAYYGGVDWATRRTRKNSNGTAPTIGINGLLADTLTFGNAANVDLGSGLGSTGPLTLIVWFYLSSVDGNLDTVISIGDRCTLRMDSYKFYTYDGSGYQEIEFGSGATGAGWYRLACIHTGTQNILMGYTANGTFVTATGAANPRNTSTHTLRFGADSENGRSFNGKGVLALGYRKALTAIEARRILDNPWREFDGPMEPSGLMLPSGGVTAATATAAAGVATVSGVGSFTVPGPAFDWRAFDWQAFDTDIPATATAAVGAATVSGAGSSSSKTAATPAAGVATVSGTAASSAASAGTAAAGVATVSGSGSSGAATTATPAAGIATVSGTGGALIPSTATPAAGVATVSAASQASTAASASAAAGVATVSAAGAAVGAGTATAAAGVATVSGTASSGGASAATAAAGVATVSASGASSATTNAAAAAGSATVSAVGTGIIPTTATPAAGSAAVSGVGSTSTAGQATATPSSGTSVVSAAGASTAQTDATAAAGSAAVSAAGSASASTTPTPADGAATVSATTASSAETVATAAAGVATVSATGSGIRAANAIAAAGQATVSGTTPFTGSIDYEAMAAAVWAFVLPNGKTAAETAVETLALLEALSDAPGCLDVPIEGIFTGGDLLRVIAAVQAGKSTIESSAPGTATVEFRAIDDSVTRVSADMVGSERADVEINAAD